jgi:hypothetical protein
MLYWDDDDTVRHKETGQKSTVPSREKNMERPPFARCIKRDMVDIDNADRTGLVGGEILESGGSCA